MDQSLLVRTSYEWLNLGCRFIEILLSLSSTDTVFEGVDIVEVCNSGII